MKKQIDFLATVKRKEKLSKQLPTRTLVLMVCIALAFALCFRAVTFLATKKTEIENSIKEYSNFIENEDNAFYSNEYSILLEKNSELKTTIEQLNGVYDYYNTIENLSLSVFDQLNESIGQGGSIVSVNYISQLNNFLVTIKTTGSKECYSIVDSLRQQSNFSKVTYDGYDYDVKNHEYIFSVLIQLAKEGATNE